MKDIKYSFALSILIFLIPFSLFSQNELGYEKAKQEVVFTSKSSNYDLKFVKFGDGFQDLSFSEGPFSLVVGGNLYEILSKLNPEYIWEIHRKHLIDSYQLNVTFYSADNAKGVLLDDFLKKISNYLEVDFIKEKVKLNVNCLSAINYGKIGTLKSDNTGLRVRKSKSHLEIQSVSLESLPKILNDNLPFRFQFSKNISSEYRYNFNVPIKNESQILGYFESLGFEFKKCDKSTTKVVVPMRN